MLIYNIHNKFRPFSRQFFYMKFVLTIKQGADYRKY